MSIHVPAWKRLGFKLKYANEATIVQNAKVEHEHEHDSPDTSPDFKVESRRKLVSTSANPEESRTPPKKKRRLLDGTPGHERASQIKDDRLASLPEDLPKRKKSVTFTSDTKSDDGDTAQNIPLALSGSPETDISSLRKKNKKPKSERKKNLTPLVNGKPNVATSYLVQHYKDNPSWKFNKNRDIWILNHAISTEDLAQDINAALANYIHGLQSSGARERLKSQTMDERTKLHATIDVSEENNTECYEKFRLGLSQRQLLKYENGSDELSKWIKAQSRTAIILWALGESTQPLTTKSSSFMNGEGVPRTRAKKSKARTLNNDIDIASSSDSGSSSSDSDEESTSSESSSGSDSDSETSSSSDSGDDPTSSEGSSGSDSDSSDDSEDE